MFVLAVVAQASVAQGDAAASPEPEGVESLHKAAEQGDSDAQYHLAFLYETGGLVAVGRQGCRMVPQGGGAGPSERAG